MGERYDISFSLKIDFSEFDDETVSNNLRKTHKDFLPHSMEQVAKTKHSPMGLHEKSFMLGNRNLIHLIEYGNGFQNMELIPAYVPKDKQMFVSEATD